MKDFDYTGGVGKVPDKPKISKAWCIGLGVVCVTIMIAVLVVGWIGLVLLLPIILGRK